MEYPDLVIKSDQLLCHVLRTDHRHTAKGLELLYFLASSPNQVFTREQLWTISGAMNTWATHTPLTYTCQTSREKSKITNIGGFQRYGASDTNSAPLTHLFHMKHKILFRMIFSYLVFAVLGFYYDIHLYCRYNQKYLENICLCSTPGK